MRISQDTAKNYWNRNIRLIAKLLTIWFMASYGIVILLGDTLSRISFFGCTLPFWFGQQGSILSFLGILIIYAMKMNQFNSQLKETAIEEYDIIITEKEVA